MISYGDQSGSIVATLMNVKRSSVTAYNRSRPKKKKVIELKLSHSESLEVIFFLNPAMLKKKKTVRIGLRLIMTCYIGSVQFGFCQVFTTQSQTWIAAAATDTPCMDCLYIIYKIILYMCIHIYIYIYDIKLYIYTYYTCPTTPCMTYLPSFTEKLKPNVGI